MPKNTNAQKRPFFRYLQVPVGRDLARKMVFVGGPRQAGKTTFALALLKTPPKNETHPTYLNWDLSQHRERLLRGEVPAGEPLLLLDEIHRFARWRNLVKGLYDTRKSKQSILVIGSARLDYYRKGGDSLQGRYHYYRLHPFSLREVDPEARRGTVDTLLRFGGFPEPFLAASDQEHRRWQKENRERVLRDDLRDLERVREVSLIECKTGEHVLSPAAGYFKARTDIPVFYQTHLGNRDYMHAGTGIRVLPFHRFCQELALP